MKTADGLRLAIDIGGTFTDTVLVDGQTRVIATAKTPTDAVRPARGALQGARHVLDQASIEWHQISGMIHGTTLATNALIERRGAKVATITTAGFRDILEIAYERRYSQYAINLEKPNLLVPRSRSLTVAGRMNAHGQELEALAESEVDQLATQLCDMGVEAVAVCLLHSYANPEHELRFRELLCEKLPHLVVSLSHEVSPEAREFDRLCTTIANAYIQPLMATYLKEFEAAFSQEGLMCPILMMTAGGGMTTVDTAARLPIRLVESGPAGGAILAAKIAQQSGEAAVLSFDMGGTTAKLCLIDDFRPQTARKFEISRAERFVKGSGMPVRIPVVEMIEIGAGGGSIAKVDRLGRVLVGPESAGSDPGPAAFGKGGERPTVTDADVEQGLIDPMAFAEGRLKLNEAAGRDALIRDVGEHLQTDAKHAARAVSEIVDESMASAGRMHAVESGKDLGSRVMIAFGGNGPLHATRVARRAQIRRILIPRDPGVGSAVGFLFAPVSFEVIRSFYMTLESIDVSAINDLFTDMTGDAEAVVKAGAPAESIIERRVAFMRYHGQGHEIEIDLPSRPLDNADLSQLRKAFETEYRRQFKRIVPGMTIEVLNWGVSLSAGGSDLPASAAQTDNVATPESRKRKILCDVTGTWVKAEVYDRSFLGEGTRISGPALIVEPQTTTLVSADFEAETDAHGNIWLTRREEDAQ